MPTRLALTLLFASLTLHPGAAAPMKITADLASATRPLTLVGLGDSITGVYYHTGGRRAWTEMLGLALTRLYPQAQIKTINAGISGNISADGLRRLDKDVLAHHPDLVVVMFGMNDVARSTPEAYEENLRQIVAKCRAAKAEVVLCTPNTIGPDPSRPMDKLRAHADIVRRLAAELGVPLADCFAAFEAVAQRSPRDWQILMSDSIHPNMRGHKLFAETIAQTITGRQISLTDEPPLPGLPHVAAKVAAWGRHSVAAIPGQPAGQPQPLRVLAMPPYDTLITPALQTLYPAAELDITRWETANLSLAQLEASAKSRGWMALRDNPTLPKPDLVLLAIPASAQAPDFAAFHRHYTWTLNWSLSFGRAEWDALAVLPSVTKLKLSPADEQAQTNALLILKGQDLPYLSRPATDSRLPLALLTDYLRSHLAP